MSYELPDTGTASNLPENFNPTKEVDMADNQGGGSNRGTAAMDEEQRREIASKGGQSVPAEERSFSKDRELAEDSRRRRRLRRLPRQVGRARGSPSLTGRCAVVTPEGLVGE